MGASRLGRLALLAVLGPFAGRVQFRAHLFPLVVFAESFLEQS